MKVFIFYSANTWIWWNPPDLLGFDDWFLIFFLETWKIFKDEAERLSAAPRTTICVDGLREMVTFLNPKQILDVCSPWLFPLLWHFLYQCSRYVHGYHAVNTLFMLCIIPAIQVESDMLLTYWWYWMIEDILQSVFLKQILCFLGKWSVFYYLFNKGPSLVENVKVF